MDHKVISKAKQLRNGLEEIVPSSFPVEISSSKRPTRKIARQKYVATTPPLSEISTTDQPPVTVGRPVPDLSPIPAPEPEPHSISFTTLPEVLTTKSTGLTKSDLSLMYAKQRQLKDSNMQLRLFQERQLGNLTTGASPKASLAHAAEATLLFAQEEAGTAICISPQGLIITCSHCVAENPEELDWTEHKWMLFASGQIVPS